MAALARERGLELAAAGVPKTIDNDLGDDRFTLIDHTPGYGSCARYWMRLVRDLDEENRAMAPSECVAVVQAMGRQAGFIPAAARLADPARGMPLVLGLVESGHTLDALEARVHAVLREHGRCMVVVSEGFDVGDLGAARDGFGHIEYGASLQAAAQVVANTLNARGLPVRGQATWQVPGVLQRSTGSFLSVVDADEAYEAGRHAVRLALESGSGWMATLLRDPSPLAAAPGTPYRVRYDRVPLETVANSVRRLPPEWVAPDGWDVTDAYVRYALPLVGPVDEDPPVRPFARLTPVFVEPRCAPYVPVRCRVS